MAEYISKEKALKLSQMQLLDLEADQDKGEYLELCENRGARDALDNAIYDIRTIKGADVQPVKHGKWKHVSEMNNKCSVCSYYFPVTEFDINYCPNCGARMNLKDGDTNA